MSTFNHDMATLLIMTDFECISWKMTWIEVVRRIYFTVAHWHPFYIDFMFWSLIPDFTILFCIKTYFVLIFFFLQTEYRRWLHLYCWQFFNYPNKKYCLWSGPWYKVQNRFWLLLFGTMGFLKTTAKLINID